MIRSIIPIAALILCANTSLSLAKPPAHKAMAQPAPSARAGCLDNSRYLSHIAFLPSTSTVPPRCGHLLSTDTLLAVRHWDRT